MRYTPPKPEDLQRLKRELDRTGEQMAELFGVAGGQQWRKYTGGAQPREMAPQVLFFGAARLALTDGEMERVIARMREIGAEIDIEMPNSGDLLDRTAQSALGAAITGCALPHTAAELGDVSCSASGASMACAPTGWSGT